MKNTVGPNARLGETVLRSMRGWLSALFALGILALLVAGPAEGQEVERGWLGIEMAANSPEIQRKFGLKTASGVVVIGVLPGSPAERAGLKKGDIITRVGNTRVSSPQQMQLEIAILPPGERVKLQVATGYKTRTATATLGRFPAEPLRAQSSDRTAGNVGPGSGGTGTSGRFYERESEGIELLDVEAGPMKPSTDASDTAKTCPKKMLAGHWYGAHPVGDKRYVALTFQIRPLPGCRFAIEGGAYKGQPGGFYAEIAYAGAVQPVVGGEIIGYEFDWLREWDHRGDLVVLSDIRSRLWLSSASDTVPHPHITTPAWTNTSSGTSWLAREHPKTWKIYKGSTFVGR